MSYLGDYTEDYATLNFKFTTRTTTGAPTTLAGTPVVKVYKANATGTETTAGVTLTVDFDGVTGLNNVLIDLSANAFYAVGNDYQVIITTGTVGGTSVVGEVVGQFSIENRFQEVDVVKLGGVAQSATDLKDFADTGYNPTTHVAQADMTYIHGTALTETSGQLAAAFKKFFDVSSPTGTINSIPDAVAGAAGGLFIAGTNAATAITTALTANVIGNITGNLSGSVGSLTGHTVQTGDTYALANGATGFAAIDTVVDSILVDTAVIGAAGAGLTAIPWNSSWDAEVQSEVNDGLVAFWTSPATLVDLIWDEDVDSAHQTAGTAGKKLDDSGSGANAADIADAVWDELSTGHTGTGKAGAQLWTDIDAILDDTSSAGVVLAADQSGVTIGVVNTLTGHTVQTGDSYAIVNNGTYGLSAIKGLVDDLEGRLTAARAGHLDNLNGHTAQTGDNYAMLTNATYGLSALNGDLDAILAHTTELQGNQADWATATGFSTFDPTSDTVILGSTGLDNIPTTLPTGVASDFREMVVATYRRFYGKSTLTNTELKTYAANGTDVLSTQAASDDSVTQTLGAAT